MTDNETFARLQAAWEIIVQATQATPCQNEQSRLTIMNARGFVQQYLFPPPADLPTTDLETPNEGLAIVPANDPSTTSGVISDSDDGAVVNP